MAPKANLGVDLADAAYKLSNTLPNIISIPLNMNESRVILSARVSEISSAINRAALPQPASLSQEVLELELDLLV